MVNQTIQLKWVGLKETEKYFINLPKKLNKAAKQSRIAVAKFLQKSARLRANRGWTGNLADSIVVEPKGKNTIQVTVGARYGYFVEHGIHPSVIPFDYLEQHLTSPGSRGVDTRRFGVTPVGWVSPKPARPFFAPALEATKRQIPTIQDRTLARAIKS